jgi:hypothetical protein
MSTLDIATLTLTDTLTMNCRVTRHLQTTSNHEHGRYAEIKPATAIPTHRPNTL